MPSLTRMPLPLAAAVCPSAPFLAPRLLRATAPALALALPSSQRALSSTPTRCDNAAKGKKSARSYFLEMRKREKHQANRKLKGKPFVEVSPEAVEVALAMQQACEQRNRSRNSVADCKLGYDHGGEDHDGADRQVDTGREDDECLGDGQGADDGNLLGDQREVFNAKESVIQQAEHDHGYQ